jgi:hypothetical protein
MEQFQIVEVRESGRFELLLTFGQPVRYKNLKLRVLREVLLLEERNNNV